MRSYLTVSRLKKQCRNEMTRYFLLISRAFFVLLFIAVINSLVFWLISDSPIPAIFLAGLSLYAFQLATPHKIATFKAIKKYYDKEIKELLAEESNKDKI